MDRDRLNHLTWSLDQAVAALWILDQVQVGELCTLRGEGEPPAWKSDLAVTGLTGKKLAEDVEDLCLRVIAENLGANARRAAGTSVEVDTGMTGTIGPRERDELDDDPHWCLNANCPHPSHREPAEIDQDVAGGGADPAPEEETEGTRG